MEARSQGGILDERMWSMWWWLDERDTPRWTQLEEGPSVHCWWNGCMEELQQRFTMLFKHAATSGCSRPSAFSLISKTWVHKRRNQIQNPGGGSHLGVHQSIVHNPNLFLEK
jgi:hypothetical protein